MKAVISSSLALVILIGCTAKKEAPINENIEVVRSMFASFNRHDWKAMADHYIDSASFLDPSFGKNYIVQSKIDLAAKYEEMQKSLPDIHDEVIGIYPSGDKVS